MDNKNTPTGDEDELVKKKVDQLVRTRRRSKQNSAELESVKRFAAVIVILVVAMVVFYALGVFDTPASKSGGKPAANNGPVKITYNPVPPRADANPQPKPNPNPDAKPTVNFNNIRIDLLGAITENVGSFAVQNGLLIFPPYTVDALRKENKEPSTVLTKMNGELLQGGEKMVAGFNSYADLIDRTRGTEGMGGLLYKLKIIEKRNGYDPDAKAK